MESHPAGAGPAEAIHGLALEPPSRFALVRCVELAQGSCFVVTDAKGEPLVVAPDLRTAHRIARFFGLQPVTVH